MLQLEHVKKSYDKKEVLTDVTYTFEEGKVYSLLGGAGAGRTTLLECICGDLSIDDGTIVTKEKEDIFLASKKSILPMYISGNEFIHYLCELQKQAREPEYYLERVGLDEKIRSRMICEYTFEEKKRIQLAAYLVQKPYVIMFDEPFDYCSDEYIDMFLRVLNEEAEGHIVIVTTGIFAMAKRIAKDVLVLSNGEINEVTYEMIDIPEIKKAIFDILGELEE